MNLPTDLNTIIALVIIVLIIVLYYAYYFIKDMITAEIKDFYIKTEKLRMKKTQKESDNNRFDKTHELLKENQELKNRLDEHNEEAMNTLFNMENLEMPDDNYENENNLDIESFVDPMKIKKDINNIDQNQILADRIFNT